jgi:hypothetical protein
MLNKKHKARGGFTLTELMVATVIAILVLSGIGIVLVDNQRGWNRMYNSVYSDVMNGSYVARATFDSVVRKASGDSYLLSNAGDWLEVYYYADANSASLDRYALFSSSGGQFNVEHGVLEPRTTLSTETICENVTSCSFDGSGQSVQMVLTLDDGSQSVSVVSSCVMHN